MSGYFDLSIRLFQLSDNLAGLINDLRSFIITYHKVNLNRETFFVDKRYHNDSNSSRHGQQNSRYSRLSYGDKRTYHEHHGNRRTPYKNKQKKKCFVCHQEGCWFMKHTRNERKESKRRYKERFKNHINKHLDKRISQYIADYEGHEDNPNNDFECDTDAEEINEKNESFDVEYSSNFERQQSGKYRKIFHFIWTHNPKR